MELQSYISCISDTLPTFSLAGEVHVPSPNKHFEELHKTEFSTLLQMVLCRL